MSSNAEPKPPLPSDQSDDTPGDDASAAYEARVVNDLNTLSTLLGFRVGFFWHDGPAPLTNGDGEVGLPRKFASAEAELIDIEDGVGHELCAHIHDQLNDPEYVANLHRWADRPDDPIEKQARHTFRNNLTDITGNRWKAELLPRRGRNQPEVYRRILYPSTDMRDQPKVMQLMNKWLRDAMVPDEKVIIADELTPLHEELWEMVTVTADRRTASNQQRFDIWTELVWPRLQPLLEEDMQQPKSLAQALAISDALHDQVSGGLHHATAHLPSSQPKDGGSDQAGMSLSDAIKKATEEVKTGGARGAGQRATLEQLTGYDAQARQEFYQILQKYAGVLDGLEDAYRRFLSQKVTRTPRYTTGYDGAELAAGSLALGYVESLAGVPNPKAWQERYWHEQIRPGEGPFDMWVVTDATGSTKGVMANMASEATAVLSMAFERYNTALKEQTLAEDRPRQPSRLGVMTFAGMPTIERPLTDFGSEKQHLDAFYHVRQAAGGSTLIHTALAEVRNQHSETSEPRRRLVVVITDGVDDNKAQTEVEIALLQELGYEVQVWNISGSQKGFTNEIAVSSAHELPERMIAIAASLVPTTTSGTGG